MYGPERPTLALVRDDLARAEGDWIYIQHRQPDGTWENIAADHFDPELPSAAALVGD